LCCSAFVQAKGTIIAGWKEYGAAAFFGRSKAYQRLIWVDDAALVVFDGLRTASAGIRGKGRPKIVLVAAALFA
jgi:hypothetical protein